MDLNEQLLVKESQIAALMQRVKELELGGDDSLLHLCARDKAIIKDLTKRIRDLGSRNHDLGLRVWKLLARIRDLEYENQQLQKLMIEVGWSQQLKMELATKETKLAELELKLDQLELKLVNEKEKKMDNKRELLMKIANLKERIKYLESNPDNELLHLCANDKNMVKDLTRRIRDLEYRNQELQNAAGRYEAAKTFIVKENHKRILYTADVLACRCVHLMGIANEMLAMVRLNFEHGKFSLIGMKELIDEWEKRINIFSSYDQIQLRTKWEAKI